MKKMTVVLDHSITADGADFIFVADTVEELVKKIDVALDEGSPFIAVSQIGVDDKTSLTMLNYDHIVAFYEL